MSDPQHNIPRKGISEPSFEVNRTSSSGPSHQTTYRDERNEDGERPHTPPPYSGPTTPSMRPVQIAPIQARIYPGLPQIDYRNYYPSGFSLSSDQTVLTTYNERLNTNPAALVDLTQVLATVPPKPQIRILGQTQNGPVDFDVRVNLMNLIVPDEEKKRMNYVKILGLGEMGLRGDIKPTTVPSLPDLEAWARRYCNDASAIKHFVLDREVTNLDTSYLEGRLLSLISATSYTGHATITFYSTHGKVLIHSPDRVNRFISNVTKVFTGTKKYEVVKSIWPYADLPRGEAGRRCAVQEEEEWFNGWKDAIRFAVLEKRKGWVSSEDQLGFLMEPKGVVGVGGKPAPWGGYQY